jgi:hypothetical protein
MSKTFLHPSQRTLKTEQIGPSSHKNEYHVGVLHGNWAEERQAFGRQANGPQRFEGRTTSKDTYPPRTGADFKSAQAPQMSLLYEAPRQLLFGHGEAKTHMLTTSELSYVNHAAGEAATPSTKLPDIAGVSKRRERSEKKQQERRAASGSSGDMYLTTKNVSLDATATAIAGSKPDEVYTKKSATHHGQFLRSLGSTMHRTGLRQ